MALSTLKTGSKLNLVKEGTNIPFTKVRVELSWNPNTAKFSGSEFDLDVSAACTNDTLAALAEEHIAFYNQKNTPAIKVSEDNRTGNGDGPDETLWIDLTKVPMNATKVPVLVTIYEAKQRGQSFADVDGATIELFDDVLGTKIATCSITENGTHSDISLLFGVFNRKGNDFEYEQVNEFFDKTLDEWIDVLTSNL